MWAGARVDGCPIRSASVMRCLSQGHRGNVARFTSFHRIACSIPSGQEAPSLRQSAPAVLRIVAGVSAPAQFQPLARASIRPWREDHARRLEYGRGLASCSADRCATFARRKAPALASNPPAHLPNPPGCLL